MQILDHEYGRASCGERTRETGPGAGELVGDLPGLDAIQRVAWQRDPCSLGQGEDRVLDVFLPETQRSHDVANRCLEFLSGRFRRIVQRDAASGTKDLPQSPVGDALSGG